jgi:hypothetical protein
MCNELHSVREHSLVIGWQPNNTLVSWILARIRQEYRPTGALWHVVKSFLPRFVLVVNASMTGHFVFTESGEDELIHIGGAKPSR